MSKYRIEIHYATGNSFGSEDCLDDLELTWENLDVAKKNLKRIKEHYSMYQELNAFSSKKSRDQLFLENQEKDWFVFSPKPFHIKGNRFITDDATKKLQESEWEYRPDSDMAENCLRLVADNGNEMQMRAFWCGYFEQLYDATILASEDSDMRFEV